MISLFITYMCINTTLLHTHKLYSDGFVITRSKKAHIHFTKMELWRPKLIGTQLGHKWRIDINKISVHKTLRQAHICQNFLSGNIGLQNWSLQQPGRKRHSSVSTTLDNVRINSVSGDDYISELLDIPWRLCTRLSSLCF